MPPPFARELEEERLPPGTGKIAELTLPSGRIVACDPFTGLEYAEPFDRRVEPGTYDVYTRDEFEQHAYAFVRFAERTPVDWRPTDTNESGEPLGYGVDAGMSCFVDAQTRDRYRERRESFREACAERVKSREGLTRDDPGWKDAFDAVSEELRTEWDEVVALWRAFRKPCERSDVDREWVRRDPASIVLDRDTGANLVGFSSGAGDGVYPSWWGFDADGDPVVLVTDFGLLKESPDDPYPEEAEPASTADAGTDLLDLLVEREWIELVEDADRTELDDVTRRIVCTDAPAPEKTEQLVDVLLNSDAVAELYCTDEQLSSLLMMW